MARPRRVRGRPHPLGHGAHHRARGAVKQRLSSKQAQCNNKIFLLLQHLSAPLRPTANKMLSFLPFIIYDIMECENIFCSNSKRLNKKMGTYLLVHFHIEAVRHFIVLKHKRQGLASIAVTTMCENV